MSRATTYRVAGLLRYAAIQFIVLTACAMFVYDGGTWFDPTTPRYDFTLNFLSDLGMTHAWSGRASYASSVLFFIALASIGSALVAFAWTWRSFAFELRRATIGGYASSILGTASGLAFVGVAAAPFDLAPDLHNVFVVAAFSLLLLYVAAITYVMWRNAIRGVRLAANVGYLALVVAYLLLVLLGPRLGTPRGQTIQVIGQKVIAYASMIHVLYLATTTRRQLPCPAVAVDA